MTTGSAQHNSLDCERDLCFRRMVTDRRRLLSRLQRIGWTVHRHVYPSHCLKRVGQLTNESAGALLTQPEIDCPGPGCDFQRLL